MTQPEEESQMQTPRSSARKGREVRPHSCRSGEEGGRGREGLPGEREEDRGKFREEEKGERVGKRKRKEMGWVSPGIL